MKTVSVDTYENLRSGAKYVGRGVGVLVGAPISVFLAVNLLHSMTSEYQGTDAARATIYFALLNPLRFFGELVAVPAVAYEAMRMSVAIGQAYAKKIIDDHFEVDEEFIHPVTDSDIEDAEVLDDVNFLAEEAEKVCVELPRKAYAKAQTLWGTAQAWFKSSRSNEPQQISDDEVEESDASRSPTPVPAPG